MLKITKKRIAINIATIECVKIMATIRISSRSRAVNLDVPTALDVPITLENMRYSIIEINIVPKALGMDK